MSIESGLFRAHALAALVTLLLAVAFGIVASLQFFLPDLTAGIPELGWGRLRYSHTQGIMFGWLGNAFLAFLYYAIPILTNRPVTSRRLGYWLFGIWNFAVMAPGWVLVLSGVSQPLEWAEFPLIVDAFIALALVFAIIQFLPPVFSRGLDKLYVSSWYVLGSLVFTALAFPMGNIVPEFVPGAAGAAFSGLWIHDAVGLFVTPLALAILYFVIPAATSRPIFSHFLSMLGFWGLFFLYPLNGTHHFVFSVIPMSAQLSAIAASALLGVIVVIVVTNLLLSLRGAGFVPRDPALRFVAMSIIFYLIVSLQGSLQAQMSINEAVHFTDWVIGHSHLAMLGFATFAAIGGLIHGWQRIPGLRCNTRALDWSYWLLVTGITIMVVDLTIAGLVEARLWQEQAPWLESIVAAKPYWIIRSISAIPITAGFILLWAGLTVDRDGVAARDTAVDCGVTLVPAAATDALSGRSLLMAYLVASVAGVAFFVMSVGLLGVWPERVLAEQTRAMAPEGGLELSAAERRGRDIYAREGCAYCHTQQIRYISADIQRFGSPTLAWETKFDVPHLMGTRRIGPDLARAGGTRSDDWHYAHLFAPRALVRDSIMPAYPWLFDGSAKRPRQEARDLVVYLDTLGRARELAWPEGDAEALAAARDDPRARLALTVSELNAHPARARRGGTVPALPASGSDADGSALWARNCSGCHGNAGRGDGPASAWLEPRPRDLTQHQYTRTRLAAVLGNGVTGTAMPAWRDLDPAELAALADVVLGFSLTDSTAAPDAAELALGAQVYSTHCAECHGPNGAGDGFAAADLPVQATDFTGQRPGFNLAVNALVNGIAGTPMAPWTMRLSNDEVRAVAYFVREFFDRTAAAPEANP